MAKVNTKTTKTSTTINNNAVSSSGGTTGERKKKYNNSSIQQQSYEVDYYQIMNIKKEQIYRMLDKYYHILNNPVTNESFANASSLYKELSKYLTLKEYKEIGEAWRNLYTQEDEQGFTNFKEVVTKVKSRFA